MNRPIVVWLLSRPPTRKELRAIGEAYRAGLIHDGDELTAATGELAELENPDPALEAARGRVALLKFNLGKARKQARQEVGRLRKRRAESRPKLTAQIRRFRAKWREQLNAQAAELRERHRDVWNKRIAVARAPVLQAEAELEAERAYQTQERRERAAQRKAGQAPAARRVARAAKAESDYEVERNIDPDLVPIWRRVKNRIRTAGTRATRTEAFLEWVAENRGEVDRMLSDMAAEAEGELEDELAAQEAAFYEGAA